MWFSKTSIGDNVLAIRFPAFAFGLLSLAIIFRLGKRLGGYKLGLAALVLLGINHTFADYSINARGYTLTIFLTLLLIEQCLYIKVPQARSSRYSVLLIAWALILVLPTNIFVVIALSLWLIQQGSIDRIKARRRILITPMIFGAALGLIFYILPLLSGQITQHVSKFGYDNVFDLAKGFTNLAFQETLFGVFIIFLVLIGFILLIRQPHQGFRSMFMWMFFANILIAIGMQFVLHKLPFPRNYIFLLPLVALLAAWILSYFPRLYLILICVALTFFGLFELGAMQNEFIAKWLPVVTDRLEENDLFVPGCCYDKSFYYHLTRSQGHTDMFDHNENTKRFIFLPERESVEDIIRSYSLEDHIKDCAFENWEAGEVYICQATN